MKSVYIVWADDSKYRESAIRSIWSTYDGAFKAMSADEKDDNWDGYSFLIREILVDPFTHD